MSIQKAYLGRLTIANGQTDSNVLAATEGKMARGIIFSNAVSAFTGTINVLVGNDEANLIAALSAAIVNATPVTVTANKYQQWDLAGVVSVAIRSTGAEGAERLVDVWLILDLPD